MALKQLTIPVVGCIRCGDDGPPLVYGDQVRLVLDQDIVAGLPPFIFGVIQPPILGGSVINPTTRAAESGTYYIVEYQSDDLLGVVMEIEPCFVDAIECVSNAEVLVERMRKIEECLLRLEVTVSIHKPIPAPDPFNIVSPSVEITFIDKAGVEQTTNFLWAPEPGNEGPFVFYPEYGASLVSVAFSDAADTTAGYSLSATSLLTCPPPVSTSLSGLFYTSTTFRLESPQPYSRCLPELCLRTCNPPHWLNNWPVHQLYLSPISTLPEPHHAHISIVLL